MPAKPEPIQISIQTARRFILGDQGLWPTRRWTGKSGTEQAMRAVQHLQLDPLDIGARAHDFILNARVKNYQKSFYNELVYEDKKFFEWGGWLATRPIEEWPYWMVFMERSNHSLENYWQNKITRKNRTDILEILDAEGPKRNRDFKDQRIEKDYRGGKVSSLTLYQLWISGEVVSCGRDRFERIYDLTHRFVPAHLIKRATDDEAEIFMAKKEVAFRGIARLDGLKNLLRREISAAEQEKLRERLVTDGIIVEVKVEGWKERHYVLTESLPIIKTISAGKIPKQWKPTWSKTAAKPEVILLSPLDIVSARGRAKKLFDFDYVWEVYKPVEQRKWGYYTLPILWGDQLVGRIDPGLDRKSGELRILGFWLESPKSAKDSKFMKALSASILELRRLTGAKTIVIPKQTKMSSILRAHFKKTLNTV
ncbi:MAG: crosslink repair DNA glycosylase YcaQ family protein [Bdellovibrionota bacterium]